MNTITQTRLSLLHELYTSYKEQHLSDGYAIYYATRDLGLPQDFCIDNYTVIDDIVKEDL